MHSRRGPSATCAPRPGRGAWSLLLACLLAIPGGAVSAFAAPPLGPRPGPGFRGSEGAPRADRARDYDLLHTVLDLRVDLPARSLEGTATHRLRPLRAELGEIHFDQHGLDIRGVTREGRDLAWEVEGDTLTIELARPAGPRDEVELEISYRVEDPPAGAIFVLPDAYEPDRAPEMWTQGQAEENQYWFPGFDDPSDVGTAETRVTVAEGYTVVGNGALVGKTDNPDGTVTWVHRLDVPIPSNLISLAVGRYAVYEDEEEGVPIRSYVPVERLPQAPLAFEDTGDMLRLFQEWNGTPYPYPVYRQVAVGTYLFGGMENAAASTLTDRCLHDEVDAGSYSSDELVAHELAHQWWGDLVSVRRWSDEWFSEGFATWFEGLWWETSEGEARAAWHRWQNRDWYLGEAEEYVRPLVTRYYDHEDQLWDGHGYAKGFWVAHMLRRRMGDTAFREFLRTMTTEHTGPVETEELRLAAERVSGLALDGFFEQWVYRGGHPRLTASWDWEDGEKRVRLVLTQEQETNELVPIFRLPLRVDLTGDGWTRTETVTLDRAEAEFLLEAPGRPRMVEIDRNLDVLMTVAFDKSLAEWIRQLQESPGVGSRFLAAQALGGWEDDRATRALVETLRDEDEFSGVRELAAESLGQRPVPEARSALLRILEVEDAPDPVRRAAARALGEWDDGAVVGALAALTRDEPVTRVAEAAAEALGTIGTEEAVEALRAAATRDSWRDDVRTQALRSLGTAGEPATAADVLSYCGPANSVDARGAALGAAARLATDLDEEDPVRMEVLDVTRIALADPVVQVRRSAARALGRLGGEEAREALRLRSRVDEHPVVRRALRDALESLEQGDELETLRDRIDELEQENRRLEEELRNARRAVGR